jgi:hypothetical protein
VHASCARLGLRASVVKVDSVTSATVAGKSRSSSRITYDIGRTLGSLNSNRRGGVVLRRSSSVGKANTVPSVPARATGGISTDAPQTTMVQRFWSVRWLARLSRSASSPPITTQRAVEMSFDFVSDRSSHRRRAHARHPRRSEAEHLLPFRMTLMRLALRLSRAAAARIPADVRSACLGRATSIRARCCR